MFEVCKCEDTGLPESKCGTLALRFVDVRVDAVAEFGGEAEDYHVYDLQVESS